MNIDISTIAQTFSHHPIKSVQPFGNGNINDTFFVSSHHKPFILQRINATVFAKPQLIFANQLLLQRLLTEQNDPKNTIHIPQIIRTRSGQSAHQDAQGNYWRAQEFVEDSMELTQLADHHATSVGRLLGQFHTLCQTNDINLFHDTLPGLHCTGGHLDLFKTIKKTYTAPSHGDLEYCFEHIHCHEHEAGEIDQCIHRQTTPKRLIHGDPKLANILFSRTTNMAHSLIDLDTIGPGFIHHDLSDLIRSCCNVASEESDQPPTFDIDKAQKIITGYSQVTASFLIQEEYRLMGTGLWIIAFELGVRFLNDYLTGSLYFKTTSPEQNLTRATNQFNLANQIWLQKTHLQNHVNDCFSHT